MRRFSNAILVLMFLLSSFAASASHVQPSDGPVYSRQRANTQGGDWNGGYAGQYRGHYGGFGGYGYNFYQPAITGSWYTRPYPTHFDYYRWRYSTPPQTNECPCVKTPAEY